jgi:hypothetical protein
MNRCPKVGDRVRYPGKQHVGSCVGTVTAIYPEYGWDDVNDRCTWQLEPEREWSVSMKPDALPMPWAYPGRDTFAPSVADLRKA